MRGSFARRYNSTTDCIPFNVTVSDFICISDVIMESGYEFKVGDKVLAYYCQVLYEAKCLKRQKTDGGDSIYYIHYVGYKASWDEWVYDDEILEINEINLGHKDRLEAKVISRKKLKRSKKQNGSTKKQKIEDPKTKVNSSSPKEGPKKRGRPRKIISQTNSVDHGIVNQIKTNKVCTVPKCTPSSSTETVKRVKTRSNSSSTETVKKIKTRTNSSSTETVNKVKTRSNSSSTETVNKVKTRTNSSSTETVNKVKTRTNSSSTETVKKVKTCTNKNKKPSNKVIENANKNQIEPNKIQPVNIGYNKKPQQEFKTVEKSLKTHTNNKTPEELQVDDWYASGQALKQSIEKAKEALRQAIEKDKEPAVEQAIKEAVRPPKEPAVKQAEAVRPAIKKAKQPAVKQAIEKAKEPVIKEAIERAEEPAVKQTKEEATGPAVKQPLVPAVEQVVIPAVEQAVTPTIEGAVIPAIEEENKGLAVEKTINQDLRPTVEQDTDVPVDNALRTILDDYDEPYEGNTIQEVLDIVTRDADYYVPDRDDDAVRAVADVVLNIIPCSLIFANELRHLRLPPKLQKAFANDFMMHNKFLKLMSFPEDYFLAAILHSYTQSDFFLKNNLKLDSKLFCVTLMQYFNLSVHKQLTYTVEKRYCIQNKGMKYFRQRYKDRPSLTYIYNQHLRPKKIWCYVYGPVYLLRLLVNLPTIVTSNAWCPSCEIITFVFFVKRLLQFLEFNSEVFFNECDFVLS